MSKQRRYDRQLANTALTIHGSTIGTGDSLHSSEMRELIDFLKHRVARWTPSEDPFDAAMLLLCVAAIREGENDLVSRAERGES